MTKDGKTISAPYDADGVMTDDATTWTDEQWEQYEQENQDGEQSTEQKYDTIERGLPRLQERLEKERTRKALHDAFCKKLGGVPRKEKPGKPAETLAEAVARRSGLRLHVKRLG